MGDERRVYYDHEPAYRRIRSEGLTGWQASGAAPFRSTNPDHLNEFLKSDFLPLPGRLLDLGCGGGENAIVFAKLGWCAMGVEFSETALDLARINAEKAGVNVNFLWGDVAKPIDCGSNTYSLVIDYGVQHCLIEKEHRRAFMENAYRALKSDGIFFSVNSCATGIIDYDKAHFDPQTRISHNNGRYLATLSERLDEFVAAGFSIERLLLKQNPPVDYCSSLIVYARKPSRVSG